MAEIQLFTPDGSFVSQVEVPPFQKPFEVIIWGERFFILKDGRYVEAMGVYHIASWGRPKSETGPLHNT